MQDPPTPAGTIKGTRSHSSSSSSSGGHAPQQQEEGGLKERESLIRKLLQQNPVDLEALRQVVRGRETHDLYPCCLCVCLLAWLCAPAPPNVYAIHRNILFTTLTHTLSLTRTHYIYFYTYRPFPLVAALSLMSCACACGPSCWV